MFSIFKDISTFVGYLIRKSFVQSAGTAEYINCISTER